MKIDELESILIEKDAVYINGKTWMKIEDNDKSIMDILTDVFIKLSKERL